MRRLGEVPAICLTMALAIALAAMAGDLAYQLGYDKGWREATSFVKSWGQLAPLNPRSVK